MRRRPGHARGAARRGAPGPGRPGSGRRPRTERVATSGGQRSARAGSYRVRRVTANRGPGPGARRRAWPVGRPAHRPGSPRRKAARGPDPDRHASAERVSVSCRPMPTPFPPVPAQPDFPAQEHAILELWRGRIAPSPGCARRTPAGRAGRSSTGRSRPTTRWASTTPGAAPTRTSSSATTPCSARTSAGRTASIARACGWRSNVERDLGFKSKRDIEALRHRGRSSSLCKQRVLNYAARADRAVDPPGHVDGLERPGRAAPPARPPGRDPGRVITVEGPSGPVTDTVEMIVGRLGMPELGRLLLHVQRREQRPHLGLPRRVPPARLALQGHRRDAVVLALRHGHQPAGDVTRATRTARTPA